MGVKPDKTQPSAADEVTPLLAASSEGPTLQANEETVAINGEDASKKLSDAQDDEERPLPKWQIFLLSFARMAEPVSFFCIFPFVNQMIADTNTVAESDVGFYSGLIESLFSLTQMCTMLGWGRLADRYGRKPNLVISLFGLAFMVSLFGFSRNIWQMVLTRCLAGVFSGSVVTIRVMFQELSTPKTQARAYSFFAFTGNLGIFIGPLIGGGLSNLPKHYPDKFGDNAFLREYPYSPGPVLTGIFTLVAAILCLVFVKETLPSDHAGKTGANKPMSTWEILKSAGVMYTLYVFGLAMLQGMSYTAVITVYWFTRPELGGLGFDERKISLLLSLAGVSQAIWLLVIFPPLQRRIGTAGVLRLTATVWPFFYALNPVFNLMLRKGWTTLFWATGPVAMAIGSGVSMAFTAAQLAINDVAPSPQTLGTINAIALTLGSALRGVIPALFASIFAVGVRNHILWGQLVWLVLIISVVIMAISVQKMPPQVEKKPNDAKAKRDVEVGNASANRADRTT